MLYYLAEGLLLILGAVVYAVSRRYAACDLKENTDKFQTRIPESLRPGKFDIFGSSHQIFHCLVVAATVVHFFGILDAFDYNYHHRTCGLA